MKKLIYDNVSSGSGYKYMCEHKIVRQWNFSETFASAVLHVAFSYRPRLREYFYIMQNIFIWF